MTQPERQSRTPIAEIFEETFSLYRRNVVRIVVVFGLFQIPLVVATLPFSLLQAELSRRQWQMMSPAADFDWLWPSIALLILLPLIALVLWTFATAGVTYVVGRARNQGAASVGETMKELRRLAPAILGYIGLIAGGWLAGVVGVGIVVLILVAMANLQGGIGIGLVIPVLLGIILAVAAVVGIVLVVTRLSLAIPALVLAREGPIDAIRRSWHLVRGSTWRTLGILFLAEALISVISSVVNPLVVPGLFEGLVSGSISSYILLTAVSGIIQTLAGPILPIVVTVLYFDYSAGGGAPPPDPYPASTATTA